MNTPTQNRSRASTKDRSVSPPTRQRLKSKEIPRSYAGLYGTGGEIKHQTANSDLLPFELSRNLNTDWLLSSSDSPTKRRMRSGGLFWTYIFIIIFIQIAVMTLPLGIVTFENSFTVGATRQNDTIANFSSRGVVEIENQILDVVRKRLDAIQFISTPFGVVHEDIPSWRNKPTIVLEVDRHDHPLDQPRDRDDATNQLKWTLDLPNDDCKSQRDKHEHTKRPADGQCGSDSRENEEVVLMAQVGSSTHQPEKGQGG